MPTVNGPNNGTNPVRFARTRKFIKNLPNKKWVLLGHGAATAVGLITAYNIIDNGLDRGRQGANEELGKDYTDLFVRTQTSPRESNLLERTKIWFRNTVFDNGIYSGYTKVKNGIGGLLAETFDNGLNVVAVAGVFVPAFLKKVSNPVVKTVIPAVSAGYLLLKGAKTFVVDVLGIGKERL